MSTHIPSSFFHAQPWAISVAGWRGLLAQMQDPTFPSARDLHARAAEGAVKRPALAIAGERRGQKLGVMKISGPMVKGVDPLICEWYGLANIDAVHEGAARALQEGVTTLVVHLDSPGGMVCGTAEAADRLMELRQMGMHLVAYTDTLACSAAYWLAAACNEIVAAPSAMVGSIGCICQLVDYSQMLSEAGIRVEYFVSEGSEAKLYGRPGLPIDDAARASFQAMVDTVGVRFKDHVAAGRPALKREDMNGDAWAAQDAPQGYVDFMTFPDGGGTERPVSTARDLLGILAGL